MPGSVPQSCKNRQDINHAIYIDVLEELCLQEAYILHGAELDLHDSPVPKGADSPIHRINL